MFLLSYLIYPQAAFTLVATRVRAAIEANREARQAGNAVMVKTVQPYKTHPVFNGAG